MKINPISISFKANTEGVKTNTQQSPVTVPIGQSNTIGNVTPSYDVKTPMKYTYLGTQELPCSTTAHMYKMENGQRVVIIPKDGSTVVKTYVNSGSMNEPDSERGISHFIEHNLFNGSKNLKAGEFFETVNKMGANTNASTGFAETNYYISSHLLKKSDLENQIKIHADMIENPRFALDMLEKEKGPVTSEINMILDDPENLATNSTIKSLYNIDSTSADIIGGTVENINNLTREKVVDYYQKNYFPTNMTTVISGEVDPNSAMNMVSKYFSSKATPAKPRNYEKLTPIDKPVRKDIISDKATATTICIGFNGPKNNDTKDKILLDAIQYFLIGSSISRLSKRLEEINSNAMVNSERISTKPEDGRVIIFGTQTSENNAENVIKMIFSEIANLEKNPPTEQEMNIVKKKLKLSVAQIFESTGAVNSVVGQSMLDNDLESVTKFNGVIDKMTSQDMVDFAKKYLSLNKVAITVVHPNSVDEKAINSNYQKANNISFTGSSEEINHKEAINLNNIRKYKVTNNFDLVTNNVKSDLATVDISLSANAPADVKPGVSNILGILLNRGSQFNDKKGFYTQLENQGISTYFDADEREIFVNSNFLPVDSANAIKSIKEVIFNPRFTKEDFEYAKNILKEDIKNTPKNAQEGLIKEMFKGQFYGTSSEDVLNNLDKIEIEDVIGLYRYIMTNAQGKATISAPLENNPNLQASIFNEFRTDFPNLKPTNTNLFESYIPVKDKNIVLQEHNKSQAEIQMGYKFKTNNNLKDVVIFELLNTILGGTPSSRLFMDLREKQKLAYQVSSQLGYFDNSGVMSLYIKTTTDNPETGEKPYDNLQKSIEGFKKHTDKLVNEPISEEELANAKLNLKNKILNSDELTFGKNRSILNGLKTYYGLSRDNQALDIIDKITVDDINTSAKYIFNSTPTISIVATKDTIDKNKDYLNKLGNIKAS